MHFDGFYSAKWIWYWKWKVIENDRLALNIITILKTIISVIFFHWSLFIETRAKHFPAINFSALISHNTFRKEKMNAWMVLDGIVYNRNNIIAFSLHHRLLFSAADLEYKHFSFTFSIYPDPHIVFLLLVNSY